MHLDLLWEYMQYDMEVDRFETEMHQSKNRQKLFKQRDFLLDQQRNIKRIESETVSMNDRLEAIQDEAARLRGLLDALLESVEAQDQTVEEIRAKLANAQKLEASLNRYEQELAKMRKDSEQRDRQQKEIRLRAARTKAEFDALKVEYDAEFKEDQVKLAELRRQAEAHAQPIEAATLERYQAVKQHVAPPMAELNNERCGGCNMSLPAAMLGQIRAGERLIECDNCGRILYYR